MNQDLYADQNFREIVHVSQSVDNSLGTKCDFCWLEHIYTPEVDLQSTIMKHFSGVAEYCFKLEKNK